MKKRVIKITKKKFEFGLILGFLTMILIFVFSWFYLVGIINFGQGNLFSELADKQINNRFEKVADNWQNSEFVESLSYVCSFQKTELGKVKCVHYYINSTFNYVNHGFGNQLRKSPEEILELGGDCKSYSVMLFGIFEKLGFESNFICEPRHVYVNVTCEDCDFHCDIDMNKMRCFKK